MELTIEARSVLRLLLTLFMLYSHIAAGQGPGSDMVGDTLMDDEDVNFGESRTGVSFTVDMTSKIKLNDGCNDENIKEDIKSQLRKKLITALGEDCKCQPSESIIDKDREKVECMADPIVRYTGQISDWTSSKYTIEQLSKFIDSWRAPIEVDANGGLFKFMFNITNSHSNIEEFGSGDGGEGDNDGSGEMVTFVMPGDEKQEETKGAGNVGGLDGESGEARVRVIGYITALSTALAILLSFV